MLNGAACRSASVTVHYLLATIAAEVPAQFLVSSTNVPEVDSIKIVYAVIGEPLLSGSCHEMITSAFKFVVKIYDGMPGLIAHSKPSVSEKPL